jgi:hypothetical protein
VRPTHEAVTGAVGRGPRERLFGPTEMDCAGVLPVPWGKAGLLVTRRDITELVDVPGQSPDPARRWTWLAAGEEADVMATSVAARPGVLSVVITAADAVPGDVGLAAAFAEHLGTVRERAASGTGAHHRVVVAAHRPGTPPGTLRIPHLAAVAAGPVGRRTVTDRVIWEVMPQHMHARWLDLTPGIHCAAEDQVATRSRCVTRGDTRPPGRPFFEANIEGLLRLRKAVREGRIPETASGGALRRLLDSGRYLSIRTVYQNPLLMMNLLAETDDIADLAPVVDQIAAPAAPFASRRTGPRRSRGNHDH